MEALAFASEGLYPQARRADLAVRNLALGILLQAFRDIVAPKRSSDTAKTLMESENWRQDALNWFFSEEKHIGSSYWVCDVLEIDLRSLRRWLDGHKHKGSNLEEEIARRLGRFQLRH